MGGVGANLVLSLLWLLWAPLTGGQHRSWIVLVGTYFAVFILADVTTTNVLGADAERVRLNLGHGVPVLLRLLVLKNLVLIAVVGIPTLVLTAVLTLNNTESYRLAMTLPGVALPILAWLGVGNLVSVLFPVAVKPLVQRWREQHDLRATARWLFHLTLAYLLLYEVNRAGDIPRAVIRALPRHSRGPEISGLLFTVVGVAIWAAGTLAATWVARRGADGVTPWPDLWPAPRGLTPWPAGGFARLSSTDDPGQQEPVVTLTADRLQRGGLQPRFGPDVLQHLPAAGHRIVTVLVRGGDPALPHDVVDDDQRAGSDQPERGVHVRRVVRLVGIDEDDVVRAP